MRFRESMKLHIKPLNNLFRYDSLFVGSVVYCIDFSRKIEPIRQQQKLAHKPQKIIRK